MSSELSFTRKASGLTRGFSTTELFVLGLMFIQPSWGIYFATVYGLALFPGANLLIALGLSFVTVGVFGPLMWGILAGTMPRSGGEYVYNSRILGAPVALAASAAVSVGAVCFSFFPSAIMTSSLQSISVFAGWEGAAAWFGNRYAVLVVGAVALVLAFVVVTFGMRFFSLIGWPLLVLGIGGPLVWIVCLLSTSHAGLIQSWNEIAVQNQTLDYSSFLGAVEQTIGGPLPQTWNWHDTFGMTGSMAALLISYAVVYIGGEVKRPERSALIAGWSSITVSAALGAGVFAALYHTVGYRFLAAGAINTLLGVQSYPPSNSVALARIAVHGSRAVGIVTNLTFILTSFWLMAVFLILLSRTLFAWGMDRMGPKWFTSVNARTATPVWDFVAYLVLCIIGLVIYRVWVPSLNLMVGVGVFLIGAYLITGLSALVLPYRKKTRDIWSSSPYRCWKIAGIPVICIAGAVWVLYTGVLLYYQFIDPQVRPAVGGFKQIYFLIACGVLGVLWYYFWAWRSRKVGVDVRFQYRQLPPE